MKLIITTMSISLVLFFSSVAWGVMGADEVMREYVPRPRLILPASDNVNIAGKKTVEFIWSPHEGRQSSDRYYDFRIYKGYNMVESTLIFKETFPGNVHDAEIDASLFDNGRVYTWSLRQGYKAAGKSRRSMQSFTVTK